MTERQELFAVHTDETGKIYLYLEERDAVLDLLEEAGRESMPALLSELVRLGDVENLKTEQGSKDYEAYRRYIPNIALLISKMTEDEALDLAQAIVRAVGKSRGPRLEIVK